MNQINLIGRLTRDPELKSTSNDKPVANMRLAIPRRDRDAAPVYVDVVAFDKLAELCETHLEQGRQVAVTGRLEYQEWEAKDGSGKRSRHSVVANDVEFLAKAKNGSPDDEQRAQESSTEDPPSMRGEGADEDIPF